jgi:hypothetical protein
MPFPGSLAKAIDDYARRYLPDEAWHRGFFNFIDEPKLAEILAREFFAARYMYKLLEGLAATAWLRHQQVKTQVVAYASIFEASLRHVLFDVIPTHPSVLKCLKYKRLDPIQVKKPAWDSLKVHLKKANSSGIVEERVHVHKPDEVSFVKVATTARICGLVDRTTEQRVVDVYRLRHAVHPQNELRKQPTFDLLASGNAFLVMNTLRSSILHGLSSKTVRPHLKAGYVVPAS